MNKGTSTSLGGHQSLQIFNKFSAHYSKNSKKTLNYYRNCIGQTAIVVVVVVVVVGSSLLKAQQLTLTFGHIICIINLILGYIF